MDTDSATAVEIVAEGREPGVGGPGAQGDVCRVAVRGRLDARTRAGFTERLSATLAEHGGVIADVSGLALDDDGSAWAFVDALEAAGEWPATLLALVSPRPDTARVFSRSGVDRRICIHPDVASALEMFGRRPEIVRSWWDFEIDPRAPGYARAHVRRVCSRWDVDDPAREAAEIVVTELVTNAVEHAASRSHVEVERGDGVFRMWVRDYDPQDLPEVGAPSPHSPRGRGLAMVAAVSRDWGVRSHADGKTVWSEMALTDPIGSADPAGGPADR